MSTDEEYRVKASIDLKLQRISREEPSGVPIGALKLGCSNCRQIDMVRHPHLGILYCVVCPVMRRQRVAKARVNKEDYYKWQGVDHLVSLES